MGAVVKQRRAFARRFRLPRTEPCEESERDQDEQHDENKTDNGETIHKKAQNDECVMMNEPQFLIHYSAFIVHHFMRVESLDRADDNPWQ